jgi:D-glycero-alpha-D-manno-heptose-7-phosphate kinase
MIISKCPLRISLAGGSTDLQPYLDKYNYGSVITFTPNLYTYIYLKPSPTKYYRIIYSNIENCIEVGDIKNDIAREVIKYFNLPPVEIIFTSDIPSSGSGLASSSSYLIAMVNAALKFIGETRTDLEIAQLVLDIEYIFNPLTGYQDIYGCIIPGLKKLDFDKHGLIGVKEYHSNLFNKFNFSLIPTGLTRSSTDVLTSLNIDKIHNLLESVNYMDKGIKEDNFYQITKEINNGWELKKETSPKIILPKIKEIDDKLTQNKHVLAKRLIGAGAGGYFLVISDKNNNLDIGEILITLGDKFNVIDF